MEVRQPGVKYSLNSSLFTDFAIKNRFIFIPPDTKITYDELNAFGFPLGSVIVKVFSMPENTLDANGNLIEIRLLIHRENGWATLPYKWNTQESDAVLNVTGETLIIPVQQGDETLVSEYQIPSPADCRTCHENNGFASPIGIKARHLNRDVLLNDTTVNQLQYWASIGVLNDLPTDLSSIDTAPNWKDDSHTLQNRAKAYLDINCSHCHSDGGSGALSGLRLEYWRKSIDYNHGVCNSSHGWRGGGFDIWPGQGEVSSIPVRMRHTDPKDRMPPVGRSLVDEDAAQLMSDWIDTLPYQDCASNNSAEN